VTGATLPGPPRSRGPGRRFAADWTMGFLRDESLHGDSRRRLTVDGHGHRQLRTIATNTHHGEDAAQGREDGSIHHEHLADELAVAELRSPVPGRLQQFGADSTALAAVDDLDGELSAPVAEVDDPHDADGTALAEGRKRNMRAAVQRGQAPTGGSRELGDRGLEAQVAAVWGQPGEDLVDDVAVARPDLADANESPGRGDVKIGIVADPGAVGAAGSGGVDGSSPSRSPGAIPGN
jgi:hypothetical protein